jgi:membrane protease YdiL (CAAX protease family)
MRPLVPNSGPLALGHRRRPSAETLAALWTAVFAILMTGLVSGTWGGLLLANLATTPSIPWAAVVMALLLWALWSYLGGRWAPQGTQAARRRLLRGGALPTPVAVWAVAAGVAWVVALAGLWVVLHRLVAAPGNPLADFSRLPPVTVAVSLVMAAVSGAVSEEAGFRGYFQGALERRGLGALSVLVAALVMAPIHAQTQGFVWPTLLFYLLIDAVLGALAYVTGSIRPGVVVHAIGLLVFFAFVWPADAHRQLIWASGADAGFWLSLAQALVFAALGAVAFVRLTRLAARPANDKAG